MIPYSEFSENCSRLRARIEAACKLSQRAPDSVSILPVTKVHPIDAVEYAIREGFLWVGENKVQEAVGKQEHLDLEVRWELIGHLQSNKAKVAAKHFDRIQTVDSLKLAQKLNHAAEQEEKCLSILIQVNAGEDPAKFGVSCDEAAPLLEAVLEMNSLKPEGLMTIAPLSENRSVAKRAFETLRNTRDSLEQQFGIELPELSMGMTDDLEEAIEAGSTQIRVGTALFGARNYSMD